MKINLTKLFVILLAISVLGATVFSQSRTSEIFLFSIEKTGGKFKFTGGEKFSVGIEYSNQPSFSLDGSSILYAASKWNDPTDIYEYDIASKETAQITRSNIGEFSPSEVNKDKISFVREGNSQGMTVWEIERASKKEKQIFGFVAKEPIGYYAWNYNGDALVWVRYASIINWIKLDGQKSTFVADHAVPSMPRHIPGTKKFTFMHRQGNDELWIKEFDPETLAVRPIIKPKGDKLDYCWMPDQSLLIGNSSELYRFDENEDKDWRKIADLKSLGINDISRIAVSPDGKHIAIVNNR